MCRTPLAIPWLLLLVAACAGSPDVRVDSRAGTAPREGHLPGAGSAQIHYRVVGAGADTVVAVHGGPGAGMHAILPELEPLADGRTLIFYDQRGGGLSELPADTALLSADHMVADLEAVRRFFELERMTLVAHSFGSILVARYAEEHPQRIERLVFFGAVGPSRAAAAELARAVSTPPDPGRLERLRSVMGALMSGETTDPVADCREYEAIGREIAIARGESGAWKGTNCAMPPEALRYYFHYTAQVGPRSFGAWDFTESLGDLEAPLLVVHGDSDPKAVVVQRAWAAAVPNGRLLLVPGAGKAVSADRPDVFYPAVETFLDGAWPAGAEEIAPDGDSPRVARVEEFRSRLRAEEYDAARSLMAPDPRRWWETREGAGEPWRIGPRSPGPWAAWDDHFRSESELVEWREDSASVTVVVRETNDYFRLLERGWVTNEITYFFDTEGRIEGLLIRAAGDRPPGRTEEFLAWAREHAPDELAAVMPEGEIDPSGDHPERFRRLLERWREAAGLPSIE